MSATLILVNLFAAVALLLWGMRMVRTGVQRAFGNRLRDFLGRWLSNRIAAFFAGFGVTTVLQSSAATCIMTADFAARGFVGLSVALAIMLGADVGTSIVAQILSLDVSWLSPVLILLGFIVFSRSETKKGKNLGRAALGIGLVLMSLKLIVTISEPLRDSTTLLAILTALDGEPLLALLIAILLTWAVHSSLAIILLLCSLVGNGAMPLTLAMILVLGANIGGALPPIIATLGSSVMGKRVAFGNGLFKICGVVIALPFLYFLQSALIEFDPNPVRVLVNLHTAFNIGLALVFIPLTGLVGNLMVKLIPTPKENIEETIIRYLNPAIPMDTQSGLSNAASEVVRMGDIVDEMLRKSALLLRGSETTQLSEITQCEEKIDTIYKAVKIYLREIRKEPLDDDESRRCGDIIDFCTNLENMADIVEKNLIVTASKRIKRQLNYSDEGFRELEEIHNRVLENLRLAMVVFISREKPMARKLVLEKEAFRELEQKAADNHMTRFQVGKPETLETSSLHLDVIRDLKRINTHLTAVAYPILDMAGELRSSRLRKVIAS